MEDMLADETAIITGASSGNGRATAMTFAHEGADIVVADVREEPREGGTPTHEKVQEETDAEATFVECDVSNTDDLENAVEAAEEFGGVDVMVNNAGIFRGEAFSDVTEDQFDQMFNVNVKGVFFGTQAAAAKMRENGGGSIINLSSVAGLEGSGDYVTYCGTKGAVRMLTYATASALGDDGIRVNAIHPGLIETKMTTEDVPIIGSESEAEFMKQIPAGRSGQPEDVADVALYLASDLSDYVTAESIVVDGGLSNTQ